MQKADGKFKKENVWLNKYTVMHTEVAQQARSKGIATAQSNPIVSSVHLPNQIGYDSIILAV